MKRTSITYGILSSSGFVTIRIRVKWCMRLLIVSLLFSAFTYAHDIITTNLTYTRDIAPIFAARCLECHGGSASIPLDSYEHARPWAVAIKEQVLSRRMPPWGAVKGFGHFQPDGALSEQEMLLIAAWVVGGAPKGDGGAVTSSDSAGAPGPAMRDAIVVRDRTVLKNDVTISGIRPLTDSVVASAKVAAKLPDGLIEPLLWLYQYDPKYAHTFVFNGRVQLPAGTVIETSVPLRFALETTANSPGQ